jgi:hypothetical protein
MFFFPSRRTSGNIFFYDFIKNLSDFGSCDGIYTNLYIPYLSPDPVGIEGALSPG